MATPVFHLADRTLGYGQHSVLTGIQLRIDRGERVALLGRSGAGKSTLLRALHASDARQIALCSQEQGLVPLLSVFHNIYMGQLDRHNVLYNAINLIRPWRRELAQVGALAAQVGLADKLRAPVESLSGGQKQRTALARALFQQRPVFIGDEPVSAVDELQARQLLDLIMHQHDTVVLALHDVDLALATCTRIVGLQQGRIQLDAPARDLDAARLRQIYQD